MGSGQVKEGLGTLSSQAMPGSSPLISGMRHALSPLAVLQCRLPNIGSRVNREVHARLGRTIFYVKPSIHIDHSEFSNRTLLRQGGFRYVHPEHATIGDCNTMSTAKFGNDKTLLNFAKGFLENRLETFNKDISICLTRDARRRHAYFPALMICIAFIDLLSGLYAGTLENQKLSHLKQYAKKFMKAEYTSDRRCLDLLYEGLRHKIAHLAYPYPVFDTATARSKTFKRQRRRRVTWKVHAR